MDPIMNLALDHYLQLWLFDVSGFTTGPRPDPFAGCQLTDIRALAIDPDPQIRIAAASSRWNWDVRFQQVLGTDPDERVVLALLEHVDPDIDVCRQIIAGPHTAARRVLAARNLRPELLHLLAADDDACTRELAAHTLVRGAGLDCTPVSSQR